MIRKPLGILIALMIVSTSHGDIPRVMTYQAKVVAADGSPVVDGVHNVRIKVFDAASGGAPLWDSGVQLVQVRDGVFEILLGQSPQPALALPFDRDYWIEVTFSGDIQSPRARLCSTGYSFMAAGLIPGVQINGSVNDGSRATLAATNTSTADDDIFGAFFTAHVESSTSSCVPIGVQGDGHSAVGYGYGVVGFSLAPSGVGVHGAGNWGVWGIGGEYGALCQGRTGVYGSGWATTGLAFGGRFATGATEGAGVQAVAYATTGPVCAGEFVAHSPNGSAINAVNEATSGNPTGVYCESHSSEGGYALRAYAMGSTGTGCGVFAVSQSSGGYGVYGWNMATTTVGNQYAAGVVGLSSAAGGRGMIGAAEGPSTACGGYFTSHSSSGLGVVGYNTNTTGATYGVYGAALSPTGYAVYAAGNFAASGTKSCVVNTSRGPSMLYCMESPENWFEDFGSGVLVDGQAHIEIDTLLLETITIDDAHPFHVFLQAGGPCGTLYVIKGVAGFDVVEAGGTSSAPFDYRIVAKRKGFESRRLDSCESTIIDPHLYPEARTNSLWSVESLHDPAIRDPRPIRRPILSDSPRRQSPTHPLPGGE